MKLNRNEHSRLVQWLDRTAEKNPLLWLPCILLIALALTGEHIVEYLRIVYSHRNTEKIVKEKPQLERKPLALRALAMSLVVAFGFMFTDDLGQAVYADEYYYSDTSNTDWQNDINVTGSDPLGNMLADEFNAKSNEQEANAGYNVFSVEMQRNTAVVDYEAIQNSTLVVGIYDESGNQLITTSSIEVTAEANLARLDMDSTKIPQYFYIKSYLINTETMRPLCTVYECPTYTQEMQEFLSKTVLDFDADRVLNLDTDISNNFAVFSEDAIISQETVNHNNVVSVDNNRNVYVIENADDIVKKLQSGDVYSQEYGNNGVLVVKVASVDVVDNTVTIYGDDSSIEDIFEYVKIDSTFNSSDVVADMSTLEEGVEYNYTGGIATYAVDVGGGLSYDHNFTFTDKDIENYKDETTSAKVNLNGSLDLHLGGRAKLYISWSQTYVELVLDYSAKLQLTFSESLHGKIPLIHFEVSPCAGVYIKFDPSIVVELDGKISLAGELSGSYGFKADKNGAHNISQSPRFTHELSAVGTFYIGVSLEPKVCIVSEKLVNAYINGRMGVEVKTSLKYGETDEKNGIRHDCKSCIDGDISIKFNLSAGIKLLNDKLSFNIDLINKQVKIADFYRSDDFGDSGFTKCPHNSYKVSAQIYGEHGAPPKETKIECSNGTVYTTDINGRVDFYLPNGLYTFEISNDKYSAGTYTEIKNKPVEISAWLDSKFAHSSHGGGSGGGGDEPVDPTPIDPDPTPTDSDFTYTISNGEVTITGYKGNDTEVVIPQTIDGKPVKYIYAGYDYSKGFHGAFVNNKNIISVTIPCSITSIGSYVFMGCTKLTNVIIPNSVISIKYSAFEDCTSLTSIDIPDSVTSIGDDAFSGCTSLENITIPDSVISIGAGAFEDCISLTNITIPDGVTSIVYYTFRGCTNLTNINIPDSVTSIGSEAFMGCINLKNVDIPDSVTSIGEYGTFYNCTNLTNVNIPYGVTTIGDEAFRGCTNLISINIPNSVISIGDYTFNGCTSLTSINIPNDVTSIGNRAFYECTNLTSITIPNSVTSIHSETFGRCTNLINITIPNSVTSIYGAAFSYCTSLTSVNIPDSITSIGNDAFYCCTSLTNINIPNSVNSIGKCAFLGCSSLTNITIPNSVNSIEYGVFQGCTSLINIIIPNSVTSIEYMAFCGCENLENVIVPDSVTLIEHDAFRGCTSLTSINIPYGVTSIGDSVFQDCRSLTSVTIPNSVTLIGYEAFWNCTSLTNVIIPNSVILIGEYAFAGCTNLTSITIPNSVTSIEDYAFGNGRNLIIYCVSGSEAESYAIQKGISYIIIDAPTANTVQLETYEIETTPVIETETDSDVTNDTAVDDNNYPIENPANDEPDLQEVIATVTEAPEVYNSYYDEPMYFTSARDISVNQTFTGLIPNEIYNYYGMKSRKAENSFKSSNLLFITQAVSDSNGNLTFSYLPDEEYSNPQIFVKAMTEFDVDNATIIYAEENDGSVSISWSPIDGASQYKVYKVVNNVYVEYQTVTATNCTVTGLSADTKCGFIVQTCIYGEWSVLFGKDVLYYNASAGEHEHKFGTVWKYDENSHWHECYCGEKADISAHTKGNGIITVKPTYDSTGIMTYYCAICDYVMETEIIPAIPDHTTHTFGEDWKSDANSHWHECICGEKSDNAPHSYGTGVVTLEPTETTEGIRTYICTVCGHISTEAIPVITPDHTVHTFDTIWHNDTTYHWHECTVCGTHSDTERHNENNAVVTVQPTATTTGTRTYYCSVCGYTVRTETIPPINDPNPPYPTYPTYPTNTNTNANTIATNEPHIYSDTLKSGWDAIISEIDFAADGSTVRVNMNGTYELPKDVVSRIQNRNINLELHCGGAIWTINGLGVTNPKTVNMRVSDKYNKIPASVIDGLNSELTVKELRLYHNGDFGFKAMLTLNVGKRYNDYYAVLYHYNTKAKQLEFIDESLVENRLVTFELTHASYYAVAFNSMPMYDDVSASAGVFENSVPIETSAMPETSGVTIPAVKLPQIMKCSNKKRRYRILKKRRLDDLVFVL